MGDYSKDWKLGPNVQLHVVVHKLEVETSATYQGQQKCGPGQIKTQLTALPERSEVIKINKRTNFVKLNVSSGNSVSVPGRITTTADKDHVCSVCSKSFLHLSRLKSHFKTHTGDKPHKCPDCAKTFSNPWHVVEHIRVHTGETPYTCPFCGKLTKTSSNLNAHIRIHTKEKPFKCRLCPKTFSRSTSAKRHSRIHYKVRRSIMCHLCPSTFTTFKGRRAHMETDHNGEKYPSFFA